MIVLGIIDFVFKNGEFAGTSPSLFNYNEGVNEMIGNYLAV